MKGSVGATVFVIAVVASCTEPTKTVSGSMKFRIGATAPTSPAPNASRSATTAIAAGQEYIVSPRQAKVTFTSVAFKDASGVNLPDTPLTNCTVVYDRTLTSGSSLLDCPFTVPVGDVAEMQLYYDKTVELLVSDPTVGIYSNPGVPSGFSSTAPAGGASFVPYTIRIGDGTSRATEVIFSAPITVEDGSSPVIYVTVDMIHTIQLQVNNDGTSLTPNVTSDPVAVFGGLTPGSSRFYSGAPGIDGYKVQGVPTLRVFVDNAGVPLYSMIGPNFCGADGGSKGAWPVPPDANGKIGGWLGKDANGVIAFALPTSGTWNGTYDAYYTMQDVSTLGQSVTLNCKVTTSPTPPADGKNYGSGAPAISAPDKSSVMKLIGK